MAFVYEKIPEGKRDYINELMEVCNKFVDKIYKHMDTVDDWDDYYIDLINEIRYPRGSEWMINTENNWFCAELAHIQNVGISSSLDLIKFLCMATDNNAFMIEFVHGWNYEIARIDYIYAMKNSEVNKDEILDSVKKFVILFLQDKRYHKDIDVEMPEEITYIE